MAERKEATKREDVRDRIPEQASLTPRVPEGKTRRFPSWEIWKPEISKMRNVAEVIIFKRVSLRGISMIGMRGKDKKPIRIGKMRDLVEKMEKQKRENPSIRIRDVVESAP